MLLGMRNFVPREIIKKDIDDHEWGASTIPPRRRAAARVGSGFSFGGAGGSGGGGQGLPQQFGHVSHGLDFGFSV